MPPIFNGHNGILRGRSTMNASSPTRFLVSMLVTAATLLLPCDVLAQTSTTYYLHGENGSNYGTFALETTPPDTATVVRQTADFKKANGPILSALMGGWSTLVGVPGRAGTIPGGSIVTFTLWM